MPSLCNSTLSSSPDSSEYQYWSSFCEKPFCCGDRLQVYKGKLNGKGPRGGDFTAVKIFLDQPGTEDRCFKELLKAQTASRWISRFIARGQYRPDRLHVTELQMAPMDQVSCLTRLLAPHRRKPNSGEWILIEEMFQARDLVHFIDKHGFTTKDRSRSGSGIGIGLGHGSHHSGFGGGHSGGQCSPGSRELVEAFVHFTHHASGGDLVLCGMEGLEDEAGRVLLKTPVIHSRDKRFGETDGGERGIQEVISRHVCNRHCRRFMRLAHQDSAPSGLSLQPSPPTITRNQRGRSPSAPYDPDLIYPNGLTHDRRHHSEPSAPPYETIDFDIDVTRLPLDVFPIPGYEARPGMMLVLHLGRDKNIPDEPPPPYTEFIEA